MNRQLVMSDINFHRCKSLKEKNIGVHVPKDVTLTHRAFILIHITKELIGATNVFVKPITNQRVKSNVLVAEL